MTRYSFFSTFFLVLFFLSSHAASSAVHTGASVSVSNSKVTITITPAIPVSSAGTEPGLPAAKSEAPVEKPHLLKMEELAHIHHFHKERVKKLKRHHKKYWILSKMLLVLCHVALLVGAYLHLTH